MAAAGAILGIAGQIFGYIGGMKVSAAEQKAEKLRERQMELESMRKKRENYRQGQISRAEVNANAVNSGAGDSSSLQGGLAGIIGSVNRNNLAVNQDTQIGRGIFKANAAAAKGRGIAAIGDAIGSFGSLFSGQGGQIQAIGGY